MADKESFPVIHVSVGLSVLVVVGFVACGLYIRYRRRKKLQSESIARNYFNDAANGYKESYEQESIQFDIPHIPFATNRNTDNERLRPSRGIPRETSLSVDNVYATSINVNPLSGPSRDYSSAWSRLQHPGFNWHHSLHQDTEIQFPRVGNFKLDTENDATIYSYTNL